MINTLYNNLDAHLHQKIHKNIFTKQEGKLPLCCDEDVVRSVSARERRVWNGAPPLQNRRAKKSNCTAAVSGSIFGCVCDSLFV